MESTFTKLQCLLQNFYSFSTSNNERKIIEQQLENFIKQKDSWKLCLNLIKLGQDISVDLFCLTSLETIVNKAWRNIPSDDKDIFKISLFELISDKVTMSNIPKLKKLCKLLVLIGKKDFPDNFPQFFEIVIKTIKDEGKHQIGIELLDHIFDEFFSINSKVLSNKKQILKSDFLQYYQEILKILHENLFDIYKKCFSPNNFQRSNSFGSSTEFTTTTESNLSVFNNLQRSKSPAPDFVNSNNNNDSFLKANTLDDIHNVYMGNLIMEVIIKYLKFLPADVFLNHQIVSILLQFASIPFNFTSVKNDKIKLSALSVVAITEIITQLGHYSCAGTFFPQIVDWSFEFLKNGTNIPRVYDEYTKNMVDFFKAFLPIFHRKYCYSSCQTSLEYLTLYAKFIDIQTHFPNMIICIQTITNFNVELNENCKSMTGSEIESFRNQLYMVMSELSSKLVKRSLIKYKNEVLPFDEYDENEFDKEYKNELANLLIELPLSCELYIHQLFAMLFTEIIQFCKNIVNISTSNNSNSNSNSNCITSNLVKLSLHDQESFINTMIDSSTVAYYLSFIINRSLLAEYNDEFKIFIEELYLCFDIIEILCTYSSSNDLQNPKFSTNKHLLLTQSVNLVSINILWSSKIQNEIVGNQKLGSTVLFQTTLNNFLLHNMTKTIGCLFQIIESHSVDKISVLSATCLLRIVQTCAINILFQSWNVNSFFERLINGSFMNIRKNTLSILYEVGCNIIVNKKSHAYLSINETNVSSVIENIFNHLFTMFNSLSESLPVQFQNKFVNSEDIKKYRILCRIFKEVINSFKFHQPLQKRQVFEAFKGCIATSIKNTNNISFDYTIISSTLEVNIASILCFNGMFKDECHLVLTSLVNLSIKPDQDMLNSIDIKEKSQVKVIETITAIMDTNISQAEFLMINNILMNYLYPLIKDKKNKNTHLEFCRLLNSLLFSKCEYFSKKQSVEIQSILKKYLEVLLAEFSAENIQLVKDFLKSLGETEDRYNLFSKAPFNDKEFIRSFGLILLQMLCDYSFSNIREDILNILFYIANNNWNEFYGNFVTYFLSSIPTLSNENRSEIFNQLKTVQDKPTFEITFTEFADTINIVCSEN